MEILDFTTEPGRILGGGFDGVWVELKRRAAPEPLRAKTLQWIDWKLQGQISRVLLEGEDPGEEPLFVPTMRKLPFAFVVLVRKVDWSQMEESCRGLGLKRVLVFSESAERAAVLQKESARQKWEALESVRFGTEDVGGDED